MSLGVGVGLQRDLMAANRNSACKDRNNGEHVWGSWFFRQNVDNGAFVFLIIVTFGLLFIAFNDYSQLQECQKEKEEFRLNEYPRVKIDMLDIRKTIEFPYCDVMDYGAYCQADYEQLIWEEGCYPAGAFYHVCINDWEDSVSQSQATGKGCAKWSEILSSCSILLSSSTITKETRCNLMNGIVLSSDSNFDYSTFLCREFCEEQFKKEKLNESSNEIIAPVEYCVVEKEPNEPVRECVEWGDVDCPEGFGEYEVVK